MIEAGAIASNFFDGPRGTVCQTLFSRQSRNLLISPTHTHATLLCTRFNSISSVWRWPRVHAPFLPFNFCASLSFGRVPTNPARRQITSFLPGKEFPITISAGKLTGHPCVSLPLHTKLERFTSSHFRQLFPTLIETFALPFISIESPRSRR